MFNEVRNFIVKRTNSEAEDIRPDTQLVDLGLDSINLLTMVLTFEKEFGIKISDRQLETLLTVDDLTKLVENQKG